MATTRGRRKQRHYLREMIPAGPGAQAEAERALTRLLGQVDEHTVRTTATATATTPRPPRLSAGRYHRLSPRAARPLIGENRVADDKRSWRPPVSASPVTRTVTVGVLSDPVMFLRPLQGLSEQDRIRRVVRVCTTFDPTRASRGITISVRDPRKRASDLGKRGRAPAGDRTRRTV